MPLSINNNPWRNRNYRNLPIISRKRREDHRVQQNPIKNKRKM
jgi:hypothetical protein